MTSMLYYPLIHPPEPVLHQGVLYWDDLGSILPGGHPLSDSLQFLADERLYTPVYSDMYYSPDAVERISRDLQEVLRTLSPAELAITGGPVNSGNRLWYGKVPQIIEDDLVSAGVLRHEDDHLRGSPALLMPLLSIVARAIAERWNPEVPDRRHWVCHTDKKGAQRAAYEPTSSQGSETWQLSMGRVFLTPAPGTPLQKVVEFRKKHDDERLRLMSQMDELVIALGGPADPDLLSKLGRRLEVVRNDMRKAAKARGISLVDGSALALIGVSAATVADLIPEAAGLGAIGSLIVSLGLLKVRPGLDSPYAYLHHVERKFGGR